MWQKYFFISRRRKNNITCFYIYSIICKQHFYKIHTLSMKGITYPLLQTPPISLFYKKILTPNFCNFSTISIPYKQGGGGSGFHYTILVGQYWLYVLILSQVQVQLQQTSSCKIIEWNRTKEEINHMSWKKSITINHFSSKSANQIMSYLGFYLYDM